MSKKKRKHFKRLKKLEKKLIRRHGLNLGVQMFAAEEEKINQKEPEIIGEVEFVFDKSKVVTKTAWQGDDDDEAWRFFCGAY